MGRIKMNEFIYYFCKQQKGKVPCLKVVLLINAYLDCLVVFFYFLLTMCETDTQNVKRVIKFVMIEKESWRGVWCWIRANVKWSAATGSGSVFLKRCLGGERNRLGFQTFHSDAVIWETIVSLVEWITTEQSQEKRSHRRNKFEFCFLSFNLFLMLNCVLWCEVIKVLICIRIFSQV